MVQDHDHFNGLNRGKICVSCNGVLTEALQRGLDKYIAYLNEWDNKHLELMKAKTMPASAIYTKCKQPIAKRKPTKYNNDENCKVAFNIMQEYLRERKRPGQVKEVVYAGYFGYHYPEHGLDSARLFRIPA